MRLSVDLDGLTLRELYTFVDVARSARVDPDEVVVVVPNNVGGESAGSLTLAASLSSNQLEEPILVRRSDAARYAEALSRELSENNDKADLDALRRLLDDLAEAMP